MSMGKIFRACAFALASSFVAASAIAQQGGIEVERPWARATAGDTGATYFSIVNKGAVPDRLMSASTPAAQSATLHESKVQNGVMMMRPLPPLEVAPGKSAELKPGADHLMLVGLKHPLKQGESFPLTLHFEKAGDVQVTVKIESAGAMGADAGPGGMHMDHGTDMHMDHGMNK
jgi:copper(I)-binding protein